MKEGLFFFLYIFKDTSHTEKGVVNKYDSVLGLALLAEVLDDSKRRKRVGENKKPRRKKSKEMMMALAMSGIMHHPSCGGRETRDVLEENCHHLQWQFAIWTGNK